MKTKIPAEQAKFIENWATQMNVKAENLTEDWYFMPFYLKKVGDNMFEVVSFENLPQYVIDHINSKRE